MNKLTNDDLLSPQEMLHLPKTFCRVRRKRFSLEFYRRTDLMKTDLTLIRTIRIAVGAIKYETPAGPYLVKAKAFNPDWHMPYSDWVPEEDQGTVVAGGDPANPIKVAFIKLTDDGIGIHGTDNLLSLGTKASHGCIRVRPKDALYLYKSISPGDPVDVL